MATKMNDNTFTIKESYTMDELLEIMYFLRSDSGCPWDRAQTHESLQGNMLEEAYEAVDAIQSGDPNKLCEELGDVLLQVVFHAQMGNQAGTFNFTDVVSGICRKLISRHTHLFGSDTAHTPDAVLETWEKNKHQEKGFQSTSEAMRDVPRGMPALTRAYKLQTKAANVGFDWPSHEGAKEKIHEEMGELIAEVDQNDMGRMREEAGDVLFAVVNMLRLLKIDPESALIASSEKFVRRFEEMEQSAEQEGRPLKDMTLDEMTVLYDAVKIHERSTGELKNET
jgi:tetrapyrrole methylase family protein/MazG family protein